MWRKKYEQGWENSRQLCKPSTTSRVCITFENSPSPRVFRWGGYVNAEEVLYCFYKITLKSTRVYTLSSNHNYRPMRARVAAQLFYKITSWQRFRGSRLSRNCGTVFRRRSETFRPSHLLNELSKHTFLRQLFNCQFDIFWSYHLLYAYENVPIVYAQYKFYIYYYYYNVT